MPRFEYKVVPAPKKAGKIKGVKGTEARFAHELAALMNEHGASGWEYQRTDTLPCEERSGFTKRVTTFQNMLVFRREIRSAEEAPRAGAAPGYEQIAAIHAPAAERPAPRLAEVAPPAPAPTAASAPVETPRVAHVTAPEPVAAPAPAHAPQDVAPPAAFAEVPPEPQPQPQLTRAQPEREDVVQLPSFRAVPPAAEPPVFSARTPEGRTPRLGAARGAGEDEKTPGLSAR
jgi:hypothetical protein